MQHKELIEIAKELLALVKKDTTALTESNYVNATTVYSDQPLFEKDKKNIFKRSPQLAALSVDIPNPGDYRTFDHLGVPILIVRDNEHRVNAFLNACRHRSARIAENCGNAKHLVCPYHSWRYDLQGQLKSVFRERNFGSINKDAHGLLKLPCLETQGMIFVSANQDADLDPTKFLGEFSNEMAEWKLENLTPVNSATITVKANWKLVMDTYAEGYHFASVHKESLDPQYFTDISAFKRIVSPDGHAHHRLAFPARSIVELEERPESQWDAVFNHFNFVYFLSPNISLFVTNLFVVVFQNYPGNKVDESFVQYSMYSVAPITTDEQRAELEATFEYFYQVVEDEDYVVTERIQKNINAGLQEYSIFGKNEPGLHSMHRNFLLLAEVDAESINTDKRLELVNI